ncbi:hypothetical protein [Streptomyces chrestomyceticus]|uniref:hypothetical protein n=1 Tax=Streptomyces chrestomyceticus TaxID=68185 RepID=UPI0033D1A3ED
MPRSIRISGAGLLGLLLLAPFTYLYEGKNAGVVIGPDSCSVGFEWSGDPGLFANCGHSRNAEVVTAYNDGWLDAEADAAI